MQRRIILITLGLAFLATLRAGGETAQTTSSGALFKAGDRWCAVGDSITHGGAYHANIYLFYATRFPTQRFDYFNCGISGDTAVGTLKRMPKDILIHKPTVASIMLGMNDVGRQLYAKTATAEGNEAARQKALERYVENMRKVATGLKDAGARLIFITPSIFDQTVVFSAAEDPYLAGPDHKGVNSGLMLFAENVRQLAQEFHAPVVDLNAGMSRINEQQQKLNPAYTLIGPDRVHPGPVGHFVMSYLFLKAQGVPQEISRLVIDAATGKAVEMAHGKMENLQAAANAISFTFTADALPCPVPDAAVPALKLVPFMQEMNQELLRVKGLQEGSYEIRIDGKSIRSAKASELAAGINLAESTDTPEYHQAIGVMQINEKRSKLIAEKLRSIAMAESSYLNGETFDPNDFNAIKAIFDRKLAPQKAQSYYGYLRAVCDNYLKYKPVEVETLKQVESLTDEMWNAARPKPHSFEIRRLAEAKP